MTDPYLLGRQLSELERLQLQARVWEPAGRSLLTRLGDGAGLRVLEVGCGAMGLLRPLSEWVGPRGSVIGTDVDARLLEAARAFVATARLANVELVHDDVFATQLSAGSFDLVHARFLLAPLGRAEQQLTAYTRLLRSGGWIVVEEPDSASWHFNPPAPAAERLIALILQAFAVAGGNFDAGRTAAALFRSHDVSPALDAHVVALPPGHPYLRLPLQFAESLVHRLTTLVSRRELDELRVETERELSDPERWGTTFTVIQAFGRVEAASSGKKVEP
jgi:SAM-dependent methyltransferase